MLTREEILKKINEKLEKMSDEELRHIAEEIFEETVDDGRFLSILLHGRDWQGKTKFRSGDKNAEIQAAWKSVGVDATIHTGNIFFSGLKNTYKIDGKTVSQYEAMQHAMNVVGVHLKRSDWDR